MANSKEIRRRIKSVQNTRQITKAMELVAASKMKKATDAAVSGQPYAALLAEMLSHVSTRLVDVEHPFFEEREVKTRGIILVTSDKGLCGAYNSNVFREIIKIEGDVKYVSIGRKGKQFLSRTKRDLIADFEITDNVPYLKIKQIVEFMIEKYVSGEVDTVEILYPRFVNVLMQTPTFGKLLPVSNLEDMINSLLPKGAEAYQPSEDDRQFVFEPDVYSVLNDLLPLFVNRQAYQAILSSKAAEHSSRMVAMKSANDNANSLLDSLKLQFNKARQAAITQEILELAASAAAQG